jgi:predicted DNA-binding protein (UPF0278 family)
VTAENQRPKRHIFDVSVITTSRLTGFVFLRSLDESVHRYLETIIKLRLNVTNTIAQSITKYIRLNIQSIMMQSGSRSLSRFVMMVKTHTPNRMLSTQTTVAIDKLRDAFEQYRLQK